MPAWPSRAREQAAEQQFGRGPRPPLVELREGGLDMVDCRIDVAGERGRLSRTASSSARAAAECACRERARLAQSSSEAAILSSGPGAASAACHVDTSELLAPARAVRRHAARTKRPHIVERTSGCGMRRPPEIAMSQHPGRPGSRGSSEPLGAPARWSRLLPVTGARRRAGPGVRLPLSALDTGKAGAPRTCR